MFTYEGHAPEIGSHVVILDASVLMNRLAAVKNMIAEYGKVQYLMIRHDVLALDKHSRSNDETVRRKAVAAREYVEELLETGVFGICDGFPVRAHADRWARMWAVFYADVYEIAFCADDRGAVVDMLDENRKLSNNNRNKIMAFRPTKTGRIDQYRLKDCPCCGEEYCGLAVETRCYDCKDIVVAPKPETIKVEEPVQAKPADSGPDRTAHAEATQEKFKADQGQGQAKQGQAKQSQTRTDDPFSIFGSTFGVPNVSLFLSGAGLLIAGAGFIFTRRI